VEKAKFHLYHDADAGEPSDAKPGLPNKAQRRLRYTNIDNQIIVERFILIYWKPVFSVKCFNGLQSRTVSHTDTSN